jgi:hypothetical protein
VQRCHTAAANLDFLTPSLPKTPADKTGYLIGSIEGRVAVQHVEEANSSKNFTFKCHRCACGARSYYSVRV